MKFRLIGHYSDNGLILAELKSDTKNKTKREEGEIKKCEVDVKYGVDNLIEFKREKLIK